MDYMEMNFCRRCGTALSSQNETVFVCENKHTIYINAAPCVGIFFLTEDTKQVLLSVRGIEPFKGALDSFGGFVDNNETVEHALERELIEELGLTSDDYHTPTFLCTETSIYPFDGEDRSILSTFFWSKLKPGASPTAADDVASIEAVTLSDIDLEKMDNADVRNAVKKLQALFV